MKKAEKADFPKFEKEILKIWEQEKIFQKSLEQRKTAKRFSFYDGPPFANGLPHYGHVAAVTIKDAVTRYKTMRGYLVPRRNGWDTHGLPVEYEVEKELGLNSKSQIIEYGIGKFNKVCRNSVFKYKKEWESFFDRIGRWADQKNAYATLDDHYIESVWWVFSEIYRKNLIYKGFKSMPYCPRCATPLSNFEVNQNYKDNVSDPSVYIMLPLENDPDTSLLAWTTTPWTLPTNFALAVSADIDYATLELEDGKRLILAKNLIKNLNIENEKYKIIKVQKGKELVGLKYTPLYDFVRNNIKLPKTAYKVYSANFVSMDDGTGIVHIAPAHGEDDLTLGLEENIPIISSVDTNGNMTSIMGKFAGKNFKEVDLAIVADLTRKKKIFAAENITHTYPFCWRCDSPLLYLATPSWFIQVSSQIKQLIKTNSGINWIPEHIKEGRFGKWLAEARDWSISRNRFWGAPIPIWHCEAGHYTVIGSIAELKSKSIDSKMVGDLHRPFIDKIQLKCDNCGKIAKRVEEVFDCWFESGSMPYGQDHYPFQNKTEFQIDFPADFIGEGLDQTRGWFYTLHVLATILFQKPAFKNVIVNGIIVAADGKKLSKRLRNYPPLEEIFERYGADTLRFFMLNSPVVTAEDVKFSEEALAEIERNAFMTLWNVFSFFSTYAAIDNWKSGDKLQEPITKHVLDKWLISRLNEVIKDITKQADNYQLAKATKPIIEFIDDLSNWYVRRNRRRFWKSEDDNDKKDAYATLHYTLVRLSQLLAPWAPFMSEKLYLELKRDFKGLPQSVHLTDWPEAGKVDTKLLAQMKTARLVVKEGLAARASAGIRARQPLAQLVIQFKQQINEALIRTIAEEINVKTINQQKGNKLKIKLDTKITHDLKLEGIIRDLIRHVQSYRKEMNLKVEDRITLWLIAKDPELIIAINKYSKIIALETLAINMKVLEKSIDDTAKVKNITIENMSLGLSIQKTQ